MILNANSAPAHHIVEYKTMVFTGELDGQTKYMPKVQGGLPDDEVDRNWEALYKCELQSDDPAAG